MSIAGKPQKGNEAQTAAGASTPPDPKIQARLREDKARAEKLIDDFMIRVGIKDPAKFTQPDGCRYFSRGSAAGRAAVIEQAGALSLRVEAKVIPLPSDRDLILPLMRELLTINAIIPGEARICIIAEWVNAIALHPITSFTAEEFDRCIHSVMALADKLDDLLRKNYGGTSKPTQ